MKNSLTANQAERVNRMRKVSYSVNISDAINSYLTNNDWIYSFDENHGVFRFGMKLKGLIRTLQFYIHVREDEYLVHAISPISANEDDEAMMGRMAEFICRANYGLFSGNFELDMNDGEIRYKVYVDCEGITPSEEVIRNSIHIPAGMFEKYNPGILDVIFCNASAKDAVDRCEKNAEEVLFSSSTDPLSEGEREAMITHLAEQISQIIRRSAGIPGDQDTSESDSDASSDSDSDSYFGSDFESDLDSDFESESEEEDDDEEEEDSDNDDQDVDEDKGNDD